MKRFDENLVVTVDDYKKSEIENELKGFSVEYYCQYMSFFENLALKAKDQSKCKICWLLHDVCSFALTPENKEKPFGPYFMSSKGRSADLCDLTDADVLFLETLVPELTGNYKLAGRIADIVWIKTGNHKMARIAIENYMNFPVDEKSWFHEMGEVIWKRLIVLTLQMNKKDSSAIDGIKKTFLNLYLSSKFQPTSYCLRISDVMLNFSFDKNTSKAVVDKMNDFAQTALAAKEWYWAKNYYSSTIAWIKRYGTDSDICDAKVNIAKSFIDDAEKRNESQALAGWNYECALKIYRELPKKYREASNIEKEIPNLRQKMTAAYIASQTEATETMIPLPDFTSHIEYVRARIKGKNMMDAISELACICPVKDEKAIRQAAIDSIPNDLIGLLFGRSEMKASGRVASRTPVINLSDMNSEETQLVIWHKMLRDYSMRISLECLISIIPALDQFNADNSISEADLIDICSKSTLIPDTRIGFWAKGLLHGFNRNILEASHLLSPQIENWVRFMMKNDGLKTSTFDQDGTEDEHGLSTLLEELEGKNIFAPNLLFELKALLANPPGPNLRNEIAHGLIEQREINAYGYYLWWLSLRIVLMGNPDFEESLTKAIIS